MNETYQIKDPTNLAPLAKEDVHGGVFFVIFDGVLQSTPPCRESVEHRCEEFLKKSKPFTVNAKTMQIGFRFKQTDKNKMKKFWTPIFKKLGKESVLLFHECNLPNVIVFNSRKFWIQNQMTRGVFTMLLRASAIYDSFDEAAKNYTLLKDTLPALEHFLAGNITPTFIPEAYNKGWYYYFKGKSAADMKKLMVKP